MSRSIVSKSASGPLKAYKVWMEPNPEYCLLVYARTPGMAKKAGLDGPWEWESWDFVHLRVRRRPQFDCDEPPFIIVEQNSEMAEGLEPFYYEEDDWEDKI